MLCPIVFSSWVLAGQIMIIMDKIQVVVGKNSPFTYLRLHVICHNFHRHHLFAPRSGYRSWFGGHGVAEARWVNYNDLTATEPWKSWLVREIIPKWPYFRFVKYYNLPRFCPFQQFTAFLCISIRIPGHWLGSRSLLSSPGGKNPPFRGEKWWSQVLWTAKTSPNDR